VLIEVVQGVGTAAKHALAFMENWGWRRRGRRHHAYGMEDGEDERNVEVNACMGSEENGAHIQ
jgi:hypothetical protein